MSRWLLTGEITGGVRVLAIIYTKPKPKKNAKDQRVITPSYYA